jgi:hypothetical protein
MTEELQESDALTVDAETKKALLDSIVEITHCLSRQDTEKVKINDIATAAQDKFGVKKKYITKMAKVMYARTFKDVQEEAAHFEALYEMIIGDKGDEYAKE